ncbi:putative transposase, Ptta/En/Spm, plant [Sesbania bispinosa]|nr:putative transposase, Ptta/En/Spm, plant [Sesbania bispinosa]
MSDEEGVVRQTCLRVQDVFVTHDATKVCTKWNAEGQPIGESASLLTGFLGEIESNFNNFPIMYETWKKVPRDYKNTVYKETVKAKFDVNDQEHKKYILASLEISDKNAANREKLLIPHTLGSKTLARKRDELEKLHNEIQETSYENEAFLKGLEGSILNMSEAWDLGLLRLKSLDHILPLQATDLESPRDLRRSSESSHVPEDDGGSSRGTT